MSEKILDCNGKQIYVGLPVAGDGANGRVERIASVGDNDGAPPSVYVQWPEWDEPEIFNCSVRDYRSEGPDGPYTYICEDIELAEVPVPDRLKDRPRFKGFLTPYIADSSDGEQGEKGGIVVLGKADPIRWAECVEERKCAMCGERLDYWIAFIGGVRSVRFRSFLDPAMHIECAEYAMSVCPWMLGGEDFAERTIAKSPTRELTKVPEGSENRIAMYVTHTYKVRHQASTVNGAPQVIVFCFASPVKRLEWRERVG